MSASREEILQFIEEAEANKDYESASKALDMIESMDASQPESYGDPIVKDGQYQIGGPVDQMGIRTAPFMDPPVAAVDTALALGTSAGADIYSSYAGLLNQGLNDETSGYQSKARVQDALTFQPRTEPGKRWAQSMGEASHSIGNTIGNWEVPFTDTKISELADGERALTNASPDGQVVMKDGQYQIGGEIGGELKARLMAMTPSALQAFLVSTGMPKAKIASAPRQTPQPKVTPGGRIEPTIDNVTQIKDAIKAGKADPRAAKFKIDPLTKQLIDDPVAIAAGKTGWNDNVIQITKTMAEKGIDRIKGLEMVKYARDGIRDLKKGASQRPDQVLGDSVMARFKVLKKAMLSSGAKLDSVAKKSFTGKKIDSTRIMSRLDKKISEWGGVMDETGTFQYPAGSALYDIGTGQKLLQSIHNQAKALGSNPSGYQLHKFKQWVDTKIKSAKLQQEGLVGAPDRFIASWRKDINNLLQKSSDDYKSVNLQYSEAKGAIDELADAFGKKRLYGDRAEEATGGIMRKWISNAPNRVPLMNAVTHADEVARKYGGTFEDSMEAQVMMANALNDLITVANPLARSSLKADMAAASRSWNQPSHHIAEHIAGKVVEKGGKYLGYSDDPLKALDSIEDLLRSTGQ